MPYTNIWIHLVWSTKNRYPYLHRDLRKNLIRHIYQNASRKGIYIDSINGYTDHLHVLISMDKNQSISSIMQLIKGESSHWINKNYLLKNPFRWQEEYFAVSVSPSKVNQVSHYIRNQENHHKGISFIEEYRNLKLNINPRDNSVG